ncbi:zinc finger protein 239 [Biomphalaria pfeifferi]|uniref:Zinc finger protein 239 n=1 Tax=Biomphalaria pfeifferi TaxID=112525 RepID=A0AAD8B8B7_BIOPF|nr:zinc finger protein 239 [Biomphalaria pfeifferi]
MEEDILSAPTSEEESPKLSCMSHCEPNCSLDQRNGMKRKCNDTEVPGEETDKTLNSLSDLKQDISYEMRETSNLNHFQMQFKKLKKEKKLFTEKQKQDKENKCPTCLKVFQTSTKLKIHQMVHKEEKPFKCQLCLKAFPTSLNLKNHQRVHTETSASPYR